MEQIEKKRLKKIKIVKAETYMQIESTNRDEEKTNYVEKNKLQKFVYMCVLFSTISANNLDALTNI